MATKRRCPQCRAMVEVKKQISKPHKSGAVIVTIRCAECDMILQRYGQEKVAT